MLNLQDPVRNCACGPRFRPYPTSHKDLDQPVHMTLTTKVLAMNVVSICTCLAAKEGFSVLEPLPWDWEIGSAIPVPVRVSVEHSVQNIFINKPKSHKKTRKGSVIIDNLRFQTIKHR